VKAVAECCCSKNESYDVCRWKLSKEFWQLKNQFKNCLPAYIPQNLWITIK